jgi:hypothetical protein
MAKLKLDRRFKPCPAEEGDELFANGIFEFNVTRLLAFVAAHPERCPRGHIDLQEIADYGATNLCEETIRTADLTRPILQVEMSPGQYVVIDGHHRVGRARREGVQILPAYRVPCPEHVPFLVSALAYEKYVEYWNSKVEDTRGRAP